MELSDISRFRKPLMGLAIVFVMLFHIQMDKSNFMYSVTRCGNVGVDIFLFLSGIGLWYSWNKNPSLKHFYHRRFWRVFPEFFTMACFYYIPDYMSISPEDSKNWLELLGNITINWCFWTKGSSTFWFIPAIMAMYIFAPGYINLIKSNSLYRWLPVIVILLDFLIQCSFSIRHSIGYLEIFLNRIPIFLIGLNCGQNVKERSIKIPASTIWLTLLAIIIPFIINSWPTYFSTEKIPIAVVRLSYIPLSLGLITLLIHLFYIAPEWLMKIISFLGGISLEMYLIHQHFVLYCVEKYDLGYCLSALISIPITVALAWALHRFYHLNIWTKGISLLHKK
jgi:peptidoglycan/LPS O-acetylase OafA/YrhL